MGWKNTHAEEIVLNNLIVYRQERAVRRNHMIDVDTSIGGHVQIRKHETRTVFNGVVGVWLWLCFCCCVLFCLCCVVWVFLDGLPPSGTPIDLLDLEYVL